MQRLFVLLMSFIWVAQVVAQNGVSMKTVSEAGTLHDQFQGESLERIKILKLKGVLNLKDLKFLNTDLRLQNLDLSEVNFDSSLGRPGYLPGYQFEKLQNCLETLILPASIEHLGDNAFVDMTALKQVEFRGKILSVGKNAFKGCTQLKIKGDEFVESTLVDDYAFYECASIRSIRLGKHLAKLGQKAFWGCTRLQQVVIDPANEELLFIPEGAFYQCTSLREVDIPTLVKSIDKSAFLGCEALATMRVHTIVPPMLADDSFEQEIAPMSVVVQPRSLKFYRKSGAWRRFRNYMVAADAQKLYEKEEEPERIRATVTKPEEEEVVAENPTVNAEVPEQTDPVADALQSGTALTQYPDTVSTAQDTIQYVTFPRADEPVVADVRPEPVVQTPEPTSEPVKEVTPAPEPVVKKEEPVQDDNTQTSLRELLEQTKPAEPVVPEKYFDSEIVNRSVSALSLYVKSGVVYIEAPVKIRQLSIIDRLGRTIYANKLGDSLYSTSIEIPSIKLIRAVYEGGVETKRF